MTQFCGWSVAGFAGLAPGVAMMAIRTPAGAHIFMSFRVPPSADFTAFRSAVVGLMSCCACADHSAGESESFGVAASGVSDGGAASFTGTGTGSGGTSGGTGDNTAVCPAPDDFEDNDVFADAQPLELLQGRATLLAGVAMGDPDYFRFTAPNADPVIVRGEYSQANGEVTDLSLELFDISQTSVAVDLEPRVDMSEVMEVQHRPGVAGAEYTLRVTSNSPTCTPYELVVDTAACTDAFEDNDELASAAEIQVKTELSEVPGPLQVHLEDPDFYQFTLPQSEPVELVVAYTAEVGDASDLDLYVYDAAGFEVARADGPRMRLDEEERLQFRPEQPDSLFYARVRSNGLSCIEYTMQLRSSVCTDVFEDNDSFDSLKTLPVGMQTAQVIKGDDDYYQLPDLGLAGSCLLDYSVISGSRQDLSMALINAQGAEISRADMPRQGVSERLQLNWDVDDALARPFALRVWAATEDCASYSLICE